MEGRETRKQASTKNNVEILSADCWRRILGSLPARELLKSEATCKYWQKLVLNDLSRRRISIFGYNNFTYSDWYYTKNYLHLKQNARTWSSFKRWLVKCGHAITFCKMDCDHFRDVVEILGEHCPNLSSLLLINLKTKLPPIISTLHFRKLTNISFDDCDDVTDDFVMQFLNTDLAELTIADCERVTGSFLNNSKAAFLESLSIQCREFQCSYLLSARLTNLKKLEFCKTNHSEVQIYDKLHLLFEKTPNLEEISLAFGDMAEMMDINIIDAVPLTNSDGFFASVCGLKKLLMLEVNFQVRDHHLEALASNCKELAIVHLICHHVTRRGLDALCRLGSLLEVNLIGSQITVDDIVAFIDACPALRRIASETPCPDGRFCPPLLLCCEGGCCSSATAPSGRDHEFKEVHRYTYWYAQWPVLFLLGTLGGILICCAWCLICKRSSHRVYMCSLSCCARRPASDHDSAGSVYPPPRYSRCGSFHQAPPPYSEVTSKPDLFPLVITCDEGDGKSGGNYLMVHYFRNYVIRAPGSLSATSTAESLNSSFICNAANEANTIVPPPYSTDLESFPGCGLLRSLSSLTDREPRAPPRSRTVPEPAPRETTAFRENLVTSPVQPMQDPSFDLELELIDCEMYCDGACKPRLGASPPAHRSPARDDNYEHEAYGLRHLFTCPSTELAGACESPPQPTSPTQSRDSTLRRPSDERRHRRIDSLKKTPKVRKASLYMPLSVAYPVRTRVSPGSRVSSRSAPATPCGALVPNLLHFSQRVSATRHGSRSSRCDEEHDPLLDTETRTDHKF